MTLAERKVTLIDGSELHLQKRRESVYLILAHKFVDERQGSLIQSPITFEPGINGVKKYEQFPNPETFLKFVCTLNFEQLANLLGFTSKDQLQQMGLARSQNS